MKPIPTVLPGPLAALLRGYARETISTGASSARVERCVAPGGRVFFLKAYPVGGPHPVEDEIDRLAWMASKALPVPRIVTHAIHDGIQYLVTEGLAGMDASVQRGGADRRAVVAVLAGALRRLHSTPVSDCPFRHDAASRVREASLRARDGLVDGRGFAAVRGGVAPEALLEVLIANHEKLIARRAGGDSPPEGMVFTHGDYCLPNVILRKRRPEIQLADEGMTEELSGFVDCGRAGVADPYQDLALCARSITRNLGDPWVPIFFEDYGVSVVDQERIDFYTLLDEFF